MHNNTRNKVMEKSGLAKNWDKYAYTFVILLVYLNCGLMITIFPPAMVDMKFIFNTSMTYISLVSTFTAVGYVIGSMAGFLYKYIDRQVTMIVMSFCMAIFTTLIPFCPNIWLLYLCSFIACIGGGAWDSSTSVWIIELWGDQSAPWLQISGLLYGVGCIVSPMIIKPYLTGDLTHGVDTTAGNSLASIMNSTSVEDINNIVNRRELIQVPYMIVGAICAIGPVLLLIMHMVKRYHVPMDRITEQSNKENAHDHWADRPEGKQSSTPAMVALSPTMRILIIALIAVSMSLYAGLEMAYFSHSPTYFQYLAISLSAKQSADLLTVATTCYTLGRISAAYMASKLRPEVMLAIHYVIIGLSLGVLYFGQTSLTAIWIGNAFFGLGLSALWSAYLSLGEKFITLNNKITAVFSIAAGILWLAAPFLIGPLIEQHPNVLMILELVYFVLSIVVFTMLWFTAKRSQRPPSSIN